MKRRRRNVPRPRLALFLHLDHFPIIPFAANDRPRKPLETAVHPIGGKEMRALRRLQRESVRSLYIFVSERGAPLSVAGYQRMVARAGKAAKFPFLIHSHMLRHSTGYKLANDGQDTRSIQAYLGHRSIVSTQRYAIRPWRLTGLSAFGKIRASGGMR